MFFKSDNGYYLGRSMKYKEFKDLDEWNDFSREMLAKGIHVGSPNQIAHRGTFFSYLELQEEENGENMLPAGVYEYKSSTHSTPSRLDIIPERKEHILTDLIHNKLWHEDVKNFLNSKDLYSKYGAMFRRNYLIYGIPGGGKSTQIRDLTRKLTKEMDAIVVYTKEMISSSILIALDKHPNPKIIIMEEVATGLEEGQYGVGQLLQWLDGEYTIPNTVVILTTNYPENIPENLMRCGRIDRFYEVGALSREDRTKFLSYFLGIEATEEQLDATEKMVSADLKELCLLIQLESLTFDEGFAKLKEKRKLAKQKFTISKPWLG